MNRKWRAIVGVTLGVCIGLMTIYIIMFESGLNSEEVLPMIIIALLGGGSYYYLYKQVKKQPDFVDASDNAKRWRRIIWGILVLGTLAGVAAYYISENRERNNQVHPPSSDDRSQLNGGTEQYNLDESRDNEKADDQRVEEAPAANEMDAAAEGMIVKSGIATVNVERAYFYKEDKITRRKA